MNRLLLSGVLIASLIFSACGGSENSEETTESKVTTENVEAKTSIAFTEEVFDFGTVSQGEKVKHTFNFKNTGENDLVIVSAKGSCGCTVPEWPKEPIAPGAEGEIFVVFDSDGKKGIQNKRVSIIANTEPATTAISLKGEVIAPDVEPETEAVEEVTTEE